MTAMRGAGSGTPAPYRARPPSAVAGLSGDDGCGRLEAETLPAHRGDQRGVAGVVAELAAHPPEVDVDGLRGGPERRVPDVAHQLVPGHHRPRPGDQRADQVELLAGQLDLPTVPPRASTRRVEPHVLHLEHTLKVGARGRGPLVLPT